MPKTLQKKFWKTAKKPFSTRRKDANAVKNSCGGIRIRTMMDIIFTRIDNRLLHGQVVESWLPQIKAQEVVAASQQLAFNHSSVDIETEHILKALLDQEESPVEFLLKKNNVSVNVLQSKLDEAIHKLPKAGAGATPAQSIGRDANTAVLRAGTVLKTSGDEFVAPEHLLLALLQGSDSTAKMLKEAGLTEKGFVAAVKELRKGDTIQSQTQETQFNALS